MDKFWNAIGIVFGVVVVFLLLYYWVGAKEIAGAFFGGLTGLVRQLQGAQPAGFTLPTQPRSIG